LWFSWLSVSAGCFEKDNSTTCTLGSFLPADGTVSDYALKGKPEEAYDEQALYNMIDGGAEKFTQHGFVCLRVAEYESEVEATTFIIWLYDQGSVKGALGAWEAASTTSQVELTPPIGDAGREDTGLPLNYATDVRINRYFIQITADNPQARDSCLRMMSAIVTNVE